MRNNTTKSQSIYLRGRKVAVLRDGGRVADIRRRASGFLYNPTMRAAVSEGLLSLLDDDCLLRITNMDSGDQWFITVRDFQHISEPVRFGDFEPQRAAELSRLQYVPPKKTRKPRRKNKPLQIEAAPLPQWQQMTMGG